jgi:hypothetical protein
MSVGGAVFAATALSLLLRPTEAHAGSNGQAWNIIWNDEFNSFNGGNWWVSDVQAGVNGEWEYYTPNHVWSDGNNLVIKSDNGCTDTHGNYHSWCSGEVQGYQQVWPGQAVEWRTQVPENQGIWPADWLVSYSCPLPVAQGNCSSWPPEIDVMEMINWNDNNGFTSWWSTYPNQQSSHTSCQGPGGCGHGQGISSTFSGGFHTFRVEWGVNGWIYYYVDGFPTSQQWSNTPGPMRVVMNTAIGGGSTGGANGSGWPQYQYIDYVRIYQLGGIISGAHYRLNNRTSGMVLDDNGGGNGKHVVQWDNWDATNQRWTFWNQGGNWWELQDTRDSGYCLDNTGQQGNGVQMTTWSCGPGNSNQNWWPYSPNSDGWSQLSNQTSGACLDNTGSTGDGANPTQWSCGGGNTNQAWEIIQEP